PRKRPEDTIARLATAFALRIAAIAVPLHLAYELSVGPNRELHFYNRKTTANLNKQAEHS
ncbi:MAG: hypothetical protein ORN83_14770, partial [Chthoniobacteraceae bacterium]|nr:hypothetical protein [Chthoniobacteraceae bacterium]